MNTTDFIESILLHEYDPVKAHEYYIRTRDLKGKDPALAKAEEYDRINGVSRKGSTTKGTGRGRGANSKLNNQRRAALSSAASSHAQAVAQLRANGERRREEIRVKLQQAIDRINKKLELDSKKLTAQTDAKIANLPDMPNGLTKAQQADWFEKRRKDIQKILGDSGLARDKIGRGADANKDSARQQAFAAREKFKSEMSASIEKARANYQAKAESIRSSFRTKLDANSDQSDSETEEDL